MMIMGEYGIVAVAFGEGNLVHFLIADLTILDDIVMS